MERIYQWLKKEDVQLYLTLAFLIFVLFCFRHFLSIILLITIFSFLALKVTTRLRQWLPIGQVLATLIVYVVVIGLVVLAISYAAPSLASQFSGIPHLIMKAINDHPVWDKQLDTWVNKALNSSEIMKHGQTALETGLRGLESVGTAFSHVGVAIFLSLIFTASYGRMKRFGDAFLHSRFKKFFTNVYFLVRKFVTILGTVVDTQLIICSINTILMTIGLFFLKMPSLMVLAVIVFILGLVPVAGVLISMVPLTLIAFASGGIWRVVEVIILVIVIHFFESYFLHPRLMATATDLPIFVTFMTLIVSEEIFGVWGLIVGLPIVAFFLDLFGVHPQPNDGPIMQQLRGDK
ncbi:AI-2E family transporter [Furfurilactobacillus milii]|uniref:AI-2E family transporter n=1 Tax=Furfurilactobacillus milii TaxID=2888272 RepID=A0A6N9I070_9LACO|nr:AI-2E family transporter [Furfurilactobacillus milii]MYV16228.1 AI-2E family transporter [Furfurilactobacillus milii]